MQSSVDVSAQLGMHVYNRVEVARRLGKSVRTIERWIEVGELAYIEHDGRVYVSEDAILDYEYRNGYVQPPLPGLEADEDFTEEQGAAVARVIDENRSRRARSRAKGGAA